jgi:hypothetical protein
VPQPEPELVLAGASAAAAQAPTAARPSPEPRVAPGPVAPVSWRGRGGLVPLLAAAAAFVMVVGLTMYRTQVENLFAPRGTAYFAGVHVGPQSPVLMLASEERLGDLVHSLHGTRIMNAPAIARDLVERRSQIVEAGGDVTALDREIEAALRPIIATSPPGIAVAVLTVLAPVAEWASADLDVLLLGTPPSPGGQGSQEPTPSGSPGTGSPGADDGIASASDPGSSGGTPAGGGAGEPGGTDDSTHDGGHGGSGEGGGDDGSGGGGGGGGDSGSGDGDGSGAGDGDDGGGGGPGQDGDGEGDGNQEGGDGDHGGAEGGDGQGEGSEDDQGGGEEGDEDCDHPGNGGGHGYGHCDGQGGGNDDHGDGEDQNSGGGNGRQAAHLLTGPILLLGLKRRRR